MRKLSVDELNRPALDDFKTQSKQPITVILDNVRSLNNVGSAFRTGDAFAIEKLYLLGITGKPPHRDIQKTALGATESVVWEHITDLQQLAKQLKADQYTLIAVEQTNKTTLLQHFTPKKEEKYAFVFGNEVSGVSDEMLSYCDFALEIPQFGTKHSLNISVSIGVVLWHYTQYFT